MTPEVRSQWSVVSGQWHATPRRSLREGGSVAYIGQYLTFSLSRAAVRG